MILLIVVFYVLILLPQRRQQKSRAEMMKKLGPGARVMTAAGLYGEIVAMQGDIAIVRIADGVDVEMDQRAIVRVVEEGHGAEHDEAEDEADEAEDRGVDHDVEATDEGHDGPSEAEREFGEHHKEHGGA
ncbi:preprotein translocase, YajC subunit [Alicyclobacillus acidocaldarius subsp. acidocaldarius Tc-4-1]|uniref:Preprotein translocase, YajC subunit n=1 Tax=Alicyclobacillus acidocaldarius (strain Tc-4-1) TaxID=1048834 RepID=F8IFP8_ALIAT|nr:preprotein translocase, YajC subunit [Alicyclobacillus acidocaldarius subsp. acidocaldarius Tc-4-1]